MRSMPGYVSVFLGSAEQTTIAVTQRTRLA